MPQEFDSIEMQKEVDTKNVPFWFSSRLGLAIIGFFGTLILYSLRINLSVAMVCMVNHTGIAIMREGMPISLNATIPYNISNMNVNATEAPWMSEDSKRCSGMNVNGSSTEDGAFLWDKTSQGILLGSFFWGYLITQLPGGILATKFGAKRTIGLFMLAASIATLLMPIGAKTHHIFLLVLRIICGLGSGVYFPAFHLLWASWAPPAERSNLLGFTYSGAQIGNIITLPLAGFLCKYGFDGGWPSIFYVLGTASTIWCILWLCLVSDSPMEHPRISEIEKKYIVTSLKGQMDTHRSEKLDVPVKAILTSMPVWAIVVANICSDWGAYTFLTQIPSYMNDVLKFDIAVNGMLSAVPYIGFFLVVVICGPISDLLKKHHLMYTTNARKLFNSIASFMPAILIIVVGFIDCTNASLAVAMLSIGVACCGAFFSGYVINPVDIGPRYSGIIFGISNTLASATGFAAPYMVGVLTGDKSRESWQIVFYITAAIFAAGAIFFIIFASGDVQPWAYTTDYTIDVSLPEITPGKTTNIQNGGASHEPSASDKLMADQNMQNVELA
ncbi:sialin-like isoform X2 [Lineus longissimus]|uniref:sialin-like isoform X2 n=1 Tax=Lineus longissimus TaxID=88925 RepID=UPI002B4E2FDB